MLINLIQIFPTTHTTKATDSPPSTINHTRPKIEYSKQDLFTLRHKHVNLTGPPADTITTIRRLKLKREKIRKTKCREQFKQIGVNFYNLHLIQTVNQNRSETVNNVRIAYINARSIKNKDDLVAGYIDSTKIDFTIIT